MYVYTIKHNVIFLNREIDAWFFLLFVAPVDLTTESVGLSWILLSWQPKSTAESYIVAVSGHGYEVNYTVDGTENLLNVTSLEHGTEYALSVIAVASNGATSTPSVTITATTTFPGTDFFVYCSLVCIIILGFFRSTRS